MSGVDKRTPNTGHAYSARMTSSPSSFRVLVSNSTDPYVNLATEEWLLDRASDADPVLLLWQSEPTVVIGKNQNPWRECRLGWMKRRGIRLARRVSGGGAVFHDAGNLNYAFFVPRVVYDADAVFDLIVGVLADLGFEAKRVNRTSLAVGGLKVSGNAFCLRRNGAMHHGTLLVESDLHALAEALRPSPWAYETRATESIRASVRNLSTTDAPLSMEQVRDAFVARCGAGRAHAPTAEDLPARMAVLQSEAWLYRQTPPFIARLTNSKGVDIAVEVKKGLVTQVTCRSRPTESALRSAWLGRRFDPDAMGR